VEIRFVELVAENFKSHRHLEIKFGDLNKISGDNAKGKSTLLETITYTLCGTDFFGNKLDPTPLTYEAEETKVSLLLSVDGKNVLLGRGLKKGKATYYINEVPSKATEFENVLNQLFDKDLFLSLYNPTYFFTLKWDKQREMLLKYVSSPANKEVLQHLPELQSERLGELLKKHSLTDIDKIHRENKTKKDKEYIAAQSRTKTLQEQLDQMPPYLAPLESLNTELAQLDKQIKQLEKVFDEALEKNKKYNQIQNQISMTQQMIEMSKERWPMLKNEVIQDTCRTCKRPLDEDSVKAVTEDKEKRIAEYKENHTKLLIQREELKEELAKTEYIDITEVRQQKRELEDKCEPLAMAIRSHSQFTSLQEKVNEAKENEKVILQSLNDSIFVIDAIKAFNAKSAELQAEKVQSLFTTLSVRLFKQNKGDKEYKPDFEIEKDAKPYRTLSLSESIKAGLELREVLSQQSEIIMPCAVDNAESITTFKQPSGQLILSRVVANQELKIEVENHEVR
jgi:hypothetical protein